jgi:hypothetical protein
VRVTLEFISAQQKQLPDVEHKTNKFVEAAKQVHAFSLISNFLSGKPPGKLFEML